MILYAKEVGSDIYEIYKEMPFTATFDCIYDESIPVKLMWDFGDDNTSSDATPSHTYKNAGIYDVSVYLLDDSNDEILDMAEVNKIHVIDMNIYPVSSMAIEVTLLEYSYVY
jgi:hypothetical protein